MGVEATVYIAQKSIKYHKNILHQNLLKKLNQNFVHLFILSIYNIFKNALHRTREKIKKRKMKNLKF